jgi:hypothetical protein
VGTLLPNALRHPSPPALVTRLAVFRILARFLGQIAIELLGSRAQARDAARTASALEPHIVPSARFRLNLSALFKNAQVPNSSLETIYDQL